MRVFVSHIHEEAPFALVLKEWIESTFMGNCDVFVSSDHDDIPAGTKWLEQIDKVLGDCSAVITICSPNSLARPWINFETGCAWIKRVPIIPICHSGLTRDALPQPLSSFQALDFSDDMPKSLVQALAKHFGIAHVPRIAFAEMFAELQNALSKSSEQPEKASSAASDQLDAVEEQILKVLSEVHEDMNVADISSLFEDKIAKIEYYLDRLEDFAYVYCIPGWPSTYGLNKEGRAYLVSKGLL